MSSKSVNKAISGLCQACGLCCSGTLFTRVPLTDKDTLLITESGLLSNPHATGARPQRPLDALLLHYDGEGVRELELPCPYLKNARCTVYSKRPARCREYECRLIKGIRSGAVDIESAEKVLREAIDLYSRLQEKLGISERSVGFWLHVRRLVNNPDFRIPSIQHRAGFDPRTMQLAQEFLAILDKDFQPEPQH